MLLWLRAHERRVLLALVVVAIVLRAILVIEAPPYGYVWDFYYVGVEVLAREGRLPVAADCWQCYHPPLFYLVSWPFYAIGSLLGAGSPHALRLLAIVSCASAGIATWYGYRLLRLIGCRGATLVCGVAVLVASPLLFISAFAPEADILLTAILGAFLFHLTKIWAQPSRAGVRDLVWLGVLAGLAAATKYSGLIAVATIGVMMLLRLAASADRRRTLAAGAIALAVAAAVGHWKYVDNLRAHGTLLVANGSASDGLSLGWPRNRGRYEFLTMRLGELHALFGPRAESDPLTTFPVYRSVPTSLHAQAWSDMTVFSVPGRHGDPGQRYQRRSIPAWLPITVIVLGLVPELLAVVGVVVTMRRRLYQPLAVFTCVTLAAYVSWFLPQESWAIKTKYIACLLAPMIAYAMVGQAWTWRRVPSLGRVTAGLLALLVAVAHLYLYAFAVGRL